MAFFGGQIGENHGPGAVEVGEDGAPVVDPGPVGWPKRQTPSAVHDFIMTVLVHRHINIETFAIVIPKITI